MAELRQQSGAGIGGVAQAIAQLAPIFLGSGKTTTNQNVTVDPGAIAGLRKTAADARANADDDTITSKIVDDIMRRAAISFSPVVGAEKQAGLYNSSTLRLLSDEAKSNATAAASKATLDYKTAQRQIATQADASIAQATRGVSTTQSTGSTVPKSASLTALAALAGTSLFKNKDDILDFFNSDSGATGGAGTGVSTGFDMDSATLDEFLAANPGAFNLSDISSDANIVSDTGDNESGAGTSGVSTGDGISSSIAEYNKDEYGDSPVSFRNVGRGLSVAGMLGQSPALGFAGTGLKAIDSLISNDPLTGGLKAGLGIATAIAGGPVGLVGGIAGNWLIDKLFGDTPQGTDIFGVGALNSDTFGPDSFGPGGNYFDNGDNFAGGTGVDTGLSVDDSLGSSLDDYDNTGGSYLDGLDFSLGGDSDASDAADDSIICRELVKQGRLNSRYAALGLRSFRNFSALAHRAYYTWSIPTVKHLRKYPESRYSKTIEWLFKHRAEHIAALSGAKKAKKTFAGYFSRALIATVCVIIGYTWCQFYRKEPNHASLRLS